MLTLGLTEPAVVRFYSKVKRKFWNQVWHTPINPAVRRVRQEDCSKFEASLDYILLSKPGLQSESPVSKKPKGDDLKKKKRKKKTTWTGSLKSPQNLRLV